MRHAAAHPARNIHAMQGTVMGRKILVGMALVAILGAVGASGYQVGKFLKERERAEAARGQ
jgi:hypothetical protein